MDKVIKVLVVDDSAYIRKVVKQMLLRSPYIEVVGTAGDGQTALEMVAELQPDLVTLDLVMPHLDGLEFIRRQMAIKPLPILIVSIASEAGNLLLSALDAGAVDFVQKPTALATDKIFQISDDLIEKVKTVASIAPKNLPKNLSQPTENVKTIVHQITQVKHHKNLLFDLVVIGISTGGPQALSYLIPQIPADFPVPIAIVLHMPVGYTELYAKRLNDLSKLQVKEAKMGDLVTPGSVLIAPAGRHLTFIRQLDGKIMIHLDARPFDTLHRPSVDVMFKSAAEIYGDRVLGVIMTGMGSDGKEGSAWIKSQGGKIFTEAESSCIVYGMPRSVDEARLSDRSFPLNDMAKAIMDAI
jgi:two-component system, chemotaxis family, protein-glutamate methylesterase/glutaminase